MKTIFTFLVRSCLVAIVFLSCIISLNAQALMENMVYDGNTFLNKVGQSFKASASGSLKSISVLSPEDVTDIEMIVYAGEGLNGPTLATLSKISLHAMDSTNDFSTIDVGTSDINIEKGLIYTFYFSTEVSLGGSAADEYSEGIMYLMDVDMVPFELDFIVGIDPTLHIALDEGSNNDYK